MWVLEDGNSGTDFEMTVLTKLKRIIAEHIVRCITSRGFSLIEVMVALSILAIGILATMQMGLLATQNITSGNIVTQAVLHAQGELERVKAHGSLVELKEKFP